MDNLVLIRAAAALHESFRRAVFREFREESPERFRVLLETASFRGTILVSLRPELPWIGRPAARRDAPRRHPTPFASTCSKALAGRVLESVEKMGNDRIVAMRFSGGVSLVAELATHGANLALLDAAGTLVASARHPRSAQARLKVGAVYGPPSLPAASLSPFGRSADEIDRFLDEEGTRSGESLLEVIRRRLFGVGSEAARMIVAEAARDGRSPGAVLAARLAAIEKGLLDPVVEAPRDDLEVAADRGALDPGTVRLLPWDPGEEVPGRVRFGRSDAASTAGLYHDALERAALVRARIDGLRTILRAEIRRAWNAEERTAEDLAGFADPDRFRIWGEALLAGLSSARRVGEHALVPDPYDPEAREIAVPADPSRTLASAAEEHFRRHRRSRRGIESARRRLDSLRSRRERLERLGVIHESATSMADGERFAEAMRAEGIPVGLEPATRAARIAARTREPRLEGVRLYVASEGTEILVGRSGRDNARLTFRLAGPEDFWLHAAGVPGAHVVVRNPRREARPALRTLEEAASLAAWFSDARDADLVDVHWTRRKHVRRVRGAPPGTVTLKRFESIRIRPAMPAGSEASGES